MGAVFDKDEKPISSNGNEDELCAAVRANNLRKVKSILTRSSYNLVKLESYSIRDAITVAAAMNRYEIMNEIIAHCRDYRPLTASDFGAIIGATVNNQSLLNYMLNYATAQKLTIPEEHIQITIVVTTNNNRREIVGDLLAYAKQHGIKLSAEVLKMINETPHNISIIDDIYNHIHTAEAIV